MMNKKPDNADQPGIKIPTHRSGLVSALYYLILLFSLNSCYYDVIVTEDMDETEQVSFRNNIVPVFQASCTSCHDGEITEPDFTANAAYSSLTKGNYVSVTNPESSTLIRKIRGDHPYAGALTETEIQWIIRWMEDGAANN